MVESDDFDDPSLPDTNSGAKQAGNCPRRPRKPPRGIWDCPICGVDLEETWSEHCGRCDREVCYQCHWLEPNLCAECVNRTTGGPESQAEVRNSGEKKVGDDDHYRRARPVLKKVRCRHCGSIGHVAPQCPVLRRNTGVTFNAVSLGTMERVEDERNPDDEATRNLTRERTDVGEALLDGGAEESVGGTKALELLGKLIGPEQILIDRKDRPWFICEDGSLQKVKSKITFHMPAERLVGKGGFYVLEAPTG